MYTYNYNIYPDILSDILSGTCFAIFSGIPSGIYSDSLFGMGTAGLSNMSSGARGSGSAHCSTCWRSWRTISP